MGFVSPRMSLKIWNAGQDPYDHEQLADNWLKVDQHDHSQGRGTPIGSEGIREGAITSVHIYPGAIGADAIGAGSIGKDKLAAESVGWQQLDPHVRTPIGTVFDWYTPNPSLWEDTLPQGWVVCMGQELSADEHDFPSPWVGETFIVPNLIGQVIMGADPEKPAGQASSSAAYNVSGTNPVTSAPGVAGVGGENGKHIFSHFHNVPGHNHQLSVTPTLGSLSVSVGITPGGSHSHGGVTQFRDLSHYHSYMIYGKDGGHQAYGAGSDAGAKLSAYGIKSWEEVPRTHFEDLNNSNAASATMNHQHVITADGNHGHTLTPSITGAPGMSGTVGQQAAGTPLGDNPFSVGGAIDGAGPNPAYDLRMAHTGLLKIMKVKNY